MWWDCGGKSDTHRYKEMGLPVRNFYTNNSGKMTAGRIDTSCLLTAIPSDL